MKNEAGNGAARRRTCRHVLSLASSCVARAGMLRVCVFPTGGPVVHHAPCQPQRTVAVSNGNGQAHTVRTIPLSVVPFYELRLHRDSWIVRWTRGWSRETSGPPKDLTKTRYPAETRTANAVGDFRLSGDTSDNWRNPILVGKIRSFTE